VTHGLYATRKWVQPARKNGHERKTEVGLIKEMQGTLSLFCFVEKFRGCGPTRQNHLGNCLRRWRLNRIAMIEVGKSEGERGQSFGQEIARQNVDPHHEIMR